MSKVDHSQHENGCWIAGDQSDPDRTLCEQTRMQAATAAAGEALGADEDDTLHVYLITPTVYLARVARQVTFGDDCEAAVEVWGPSLGDMHVRTSMIIEGNLRQFSQVAAISYAGERDSVRVIR